MPTRQLLLVVSAAQLAVSVMSHFVAVRKGRSFEIFHWRGDPKHVAREAWLMGTGLSAPVHMMVVHAAATAVLVGRRSRGAAAMLGALGVTMTVGYLIENKFRGALRHPPEDPVVTAIGGPGFVLAVAMAVIGIREARSEGFAQRSK